MNDMVAIAVAPSIAKVCHEANRAYCEVLGEAGKPPWDEADQKTRESAIQGVLLMIRGETNGPKDQHEAWYQTKINEGWTYAKVRDNEKKTHPCLVPYDELPIQQKVKDHLFRAVVKAVLKGV
jgi:hypothetical protein